ncbi:MAG: methyl-accepting chemotaxis protein, partial [Treponema sp.]|nr:methyl-accepting chemotaxis protein [Treponema sp.]
MLAPVITFFSGVLLVLIVCVPMLYYRGRKIRGLEKTAARADAGRAGFNSKLAELASAVRESANALADNGSGNSGGIDMLKIENSIDENTRIVAEIADKTGSVASIASKMEEDVLRGFEVLEKNVKKMGEIKEKNSGIISGIIMLSGKVNKIRDIVRVINTITDQTKVIAFNAALEAAGAGETGKRFSVVAGEVNRLADDIAVLTRQIREQVEEIQSSSSSLIIYSEEGS